MLYVIHSSSKYEENILNTLMHNTKYPFKTIINVRNDEEMEKLPKRGSFSGNDFLLLYDEVKGTPALIKSLNEYYKEEVIDDILEYIKSEAGNVVVVPKISSFMADKEMMNETWEKIKSLTKVNLQAIDRDIIPSKVNQILSELKESQEEEKTYLIRVKNSALEIRPDKFEPTMENSITLSELIVLYIAKETFNIDRIGIVDN